MPSLEQAGLQVEWVPIEAVRENPDNPRVIPDSAIDGVAASIKRFGWQQPLVVDPSGLILAGHTRRRAAERLALGSIPIVRFNGSGRDALAFAVADNQLHSLTAWDDPSLAKILQTLRAEDGGLVGVGFDDAEADRLIREFIADQPRTPVDDVGPQEPPKVAVTHPGDLWILAGANGQHRLMCGSATERADVERLMGGARTRLLSTDPPYLVDYNGCNHPTSKSARANVARGNVDTQNREWDEYVDHEASIEFYETFLRIAIDVACTPNPAVYQWHASRRQALLEDAWNRVGLFVHQQIVWAKSRPILTRSHYMWQHEPCFYGWIKGKTPDLRPECCGDNVTIWTIGQAGEYDSIHPTQKPIEIFRKPMRAHTLPGDICYEPFSGSGSNIMAGVSEGRRVFAMELSPAFVDAALLRFMRSTGGAIVLDGTAARFEAVADERGVRIDVESDHGRARAKAGEPAPIAESAG